MFEIFHRSRKGDIIHTDIYDAALQGDDQAVALLGAALLTGIGTDRDIERGISLLKGAASRGNALAARSLVHAFLTESYGMLDFEQGIPYLRQSASYGEPESLYNLGMMMLEGTQFVEKDVISARALIKESADKGYDKAVRMMAARFGA